MLRSGITSCWHVARDGYDSSCCRKWQSASEHVDQVHLCLCFFVQDVCYYVNSALLLYCWVAPSTPQLFHAIYALTHGPLLMAVALFRNSLVFHSADKLTSAFIHISPFLLTHLIRWYPEGADIPLIRFDLNQVWCNDGDAHHALLNNRFRVIAQTFRTM